MCSNVNVRTLELFIYFLAANMTSWKREFSWKPWWDDVI